MSKRDSEIPERINLARREDCRTSFRLFMQTHMPLTFSKPFPPDHYAIIARIESAIIGECRVSSDEMKRGAGKTSIIKAAAIWAVLYGYSQFVLIVGRNAQFAASLLASIKCELERNDLLMEDFPEACFPIRDLGGDPRQCLMQTYQGNPAGVRWSADTIVMPTITGSTSSNATIRAVSSTTTMKGHKFTRHDGMVVRPTLVLVDDPIIDKESLARLNSIADKWSAVVLYTPVTGKTMSNEQEPIADGFQIRAEDTEVGLPVTIHQLIEHMERTKDSSGGGMVSFVPGPGKSLPPGWTVTQEHESDEPTETCFRCSGAGVYWGYDPATKQNRELVCYCKRQAETA